MTNLLDWPLDLPCGATLSNCVAKAAMSEGLADSGNHSTPRLETLYQRWAGSGASLLLSGKSGELHAAALNASDFQKGGFTNAECVELVRLLNGVGLDLLEFSGGSLEQPEVVGVTLKDEGEDGPRASAMRREAYFVAFAGAVREVAAMPVMVTGGFGSIAGMVEAHEGGDLDVVGLARPLIAEPEAPRRLLAGEIDKLLSPEASLSVFHILPWNYMRSNGSPTASTPDAVLRDVRRCDRSRLHPV
jgi:2,4-dienoyl-CoA reductase-like NADH-dependent reductase (Old Yellow Enzyme family)